jgi:endoglucanase
MRLVSGFVTLGLAVSGLVSASAPTAAALSATQAGRLGSLARCRLGPARAVVVAGPGATAGANAARPGPAAVIRVDQIGYPTSATKLAEIMTRSRRAGTHWELIRRSSCAVVARGTARTDLGSWSTKYPAVWAVDFSGVHRAGMYRLMLTGHLATASPWFRIGGPSSLYRRPLANALSFFQNERDGPDFIRSPLRTAPGHLNDARAMTFRAPPVDQNGNFKGSLRRFATGLAINATGGWFDAGDFLHFTETTSYAVAVMLQAVAAFPAQAGRHGQVSFVAEAKFGVDFLRRMWNERGRTLYLQVGTGEANNYYVADHDIWRLPQADDHYKGTNPHYQYIRHPPVFRAGKPGSPISPNLAGRLAADFALCYRVFKPTRPGYANGCLRSARTIYSMAARYWKGNLATVLPWDFYPEVSWRDDMMLGATELALALHAAGRPGQAATYLREAAHWARAWFGGKADGQDTLNLYDVSALADYELYRAIGVIPVRRLRVTRTALVADLRGQIAHAARIGAREPFGYGFAWNQWDTTTHGLGLSVMADEYDALVGRPVYAAWGQRQLDNVLGANPWGVSLIVGDGTVFPHCMQHQVANLIGSRSGTAPVLAGAVVEGPNSFAATGVVTNMRPCRANAPGNVPYAAFNGRGAVFADNVQSFSTVEPAIDLTSISPLAFAWQEAGRRAGY